MVTFLLLSVVSVLAQTPEDNLNRISEDLVGFYEEDADYETLYEGLMQRMSAPVNVNKASAEELRWMNLFTEHEVQSILRYRDAQGPLLSIYELQFIPGMDLVRLRQLAPMLMVNDPGKGVNRSLVTRMLHNDQYLILRYEQKLERSNGFVNADPSRQFQGPDGKWYMRFRNNRPGDFSVGFTAERDPGEPFRWNRQAHHYGFDFVSGHLQLRDKGPVRNLIIGDFRAQFGQGLIHGGGFGLGKGGETISTVRRANTGFMPYTSAGETGFRRGIAASVAVTPRLSLSGFGSRLRQDAAIDDLISIQQTGLHRNTAELRGRRSVLERGYGAGIHYRQRRMESGILWNSSQFSHPLNPRSMPYNQFAFRGLRSSAASAYLNYNTNNFAFFGEVATSFDAAWGWLAGLLGSLTPKIDVSMMLRSYDPAFHASYANAFAENSRPQNERGFYWGCKYQLNRQLSVSAYADLFRFPWLGFRRYAPSTGHEWLVKVAWQRRRKLKAFIQLREASKVQNVSTSSIYETERMTTRMFWAGLSVWANDRLRLQSHVRFSNFQRGSGTGRGILIAQDVSVSVGKFRLSGRHAIIDIADFENRQYMYEQDAWMAFSLPPYYGVGVRNYLLLQWKASKLISLWLRYAHQRFIDREEIGSGNDGIPGNTRNDLKVQVMFRF